ncbi:MAG: hypothetical protein AAGJ86_06300 [Pseudomonadota bacterium]
MQAGNPDLQVITGDKAAAADPVTLAVSLPASPDDEGAVNAALAAADAQMRVKFSGSQSLTTNPDLIIDQGLSAPSFIVTPVRSLRGIRKSPVAPFDVLVVARPSSIDIETAPTLDAAAYLARRFGRDQIIMLAKDPIALARLPAAPALPGGLTVEQMTLAEFTQRLIAGQAPRAVVATVTGMQQAVADVLASLAGTENLTSTFIHDGALRVSAAGVVTSSHVSGLLPALATLLALRTESDAARFLELAWLRCLEDGLATDGLFSVQPHSTVLSMVEFCQALRERSATPPRRIAASLPPPEQQSRPRLRLV